MNRKTWISLNLRVYAIANTIAMLAFFCGVGAESALANNNFILFVILTVLGAQIVPFVVSIWVVRKIADAEIKEEGNNPD